MRFENTIIKNSFYYFGWLGYPLEPSIKIQEFFWHILEILEIENLKKNHFTWK
jgi:hypothetical protein